MTSQYADAHERAIKDQFTRQASGFAGAKELHADEVVGLVVEAARPQPGDKAIDLACGSGLLATALARHAPGARVVATDVSEVAVRSAALTAAANGVRVETVHDDGLGAQPDASADLIVLNPPFHVGAAVHTGIALRLFAEAARVLRPGGELRAVWNSHLDYRPALGRIVGPTRQVARTSKFTVTASRRA